MVRSKAVLTWCFRALWREDPALRRFDNLKGFRNDQANSSIPVFFTQRATLT